MSNPPPTLVSTFEILFTPQLPPGLGPTQVSQVDELVVKGYFLTIANPNPAAYTFTLGFHCNVNPNPASPQRTLASAVGFLDDASTGNPLTISPGATATDFFAEVNVAAEGTVLVGILPAFFTGTGLANPTIECRGWVDITLPALLKRISVGPRTTFEFVSQAEAPVTVLLTPEQRLTFLPMSGDSATAVEAQSAFGLPPASGAGAFAIPPQPGGLPLLGEDAMGEAVSEDTLPSLSRIAQGPRGHLAVLLRTLVAASPAVQKGSVPLDEALRSLGFTG